MKIDYNDLNISGRKPPRQAFNVIKSGKVVVYVI